MWRKYVSLVGLLQAAAILTIVFSLVTAIPVDHFGIQLFTHFKLQYLLVSVLLCVVLALYRRPAYVGGLMFAFGEGQSKRALAGIVFGVGMAIGAVNFMAWLFP